MKYVPVLAAAALVVTAACGSGRGARDSQTPTADYPTTNSSAPVIHERDTDRITLTGCLVDSGLDRSYLLHASSPERRDYRVIPQADADVASHVNQLVSIRAFLELPSGVAVGAGAIDASANSPVGSAGTGGPEAEGTVGANAPRSGGTLNPGGLQVARADTITKLADSCGGDRR